MTPRQVVTDALHKASVMPTELLTLPAWTHDEPDPWPMDREHRDTIPPFQPGDRVEHLGSRGYFGTVQRVEPHLFGDPDYYADVLVRWDDDRPSDLLAGRVSRAGLRSLRVI